MEWAAYDAIEPIGDWRGDLRMARIAQALTGHKEPLDFVFFLTEEDRRNMKMEKEMAALQAMAKRDN